MLHTRFPKPWGLGCWAFAEALAAVAWSSASPRQPVLAEANARLTRLSGPKSSSRTAEADAVAVRSLVSRESGRPKARAVPARF